MVSLYSILFVRSPRFTPHTGSKGTSVEEKVPPYILIYFFKVVGIYLSTRIQLLEA